MKISFLKLVCSMFFLCALTQAATAQTGSDRVSVMTYNVENLFDWQHDKGKNDLTYLPKAEKQNAAQRYVCSGMRREKWRDQCLNYDWSEPNVRKKMEQLSKVVLSVNKGRGPDVLILQEVENKNILDLFRNDFLRAASYETAVLIEGPDARGIDVALLSRLPLNGKAKTHGIPFKSISKERAMDTRPILEVPLKLPDGSPLHVFGVHFPAPYHPWKMRKEAFNFLNTLIKDLPKNATAVAGGDFNVPSEEEKKRRLFKDIAGSKWQVAFYEGCSKCKGSHYYAPKNSWSFLDSLLLAKKSKTKGAQKVWSLDTASIKVVKTPVQLNDKGHPQSFDLKTKEGASDHLPVYAEIAFY